MIAISRNGRYDLSFLLIPPFGGMTRRLPRRSFLTPRNDEKFHAKSVMILQRALHFLNFVQIPK